MYGIVGEFFSLLLGLYIHFNSNSLCETFVADCLPMIQPIEMRLSMHVRTCRDAVYVHTTILHAYILHTALYIYFQQFQLNIYNFSTYFMTLGLVHILTHFV